MRILRQLSLLFTLGLITNCLYAQRSIGIFSDLHPGLSVEPNSVEPIYGASIGLALKKWRSDRKFVRTSISRFTYRSIHKGVGSQSNPVGGTYLFNYETVEKWKLTSLAFAWSKTIGQGEADDPFIFYRTLGFGIGMNQYTATNTRLDNGAVIENYYNRNFTHYLPSLLAGLGFEFRVYPKIYMNTELTFQVTESFFGLIPKISLTYRLYQ